MLLVITSLALISLDERGSGRHRLGPHRGPGRGLAAPEPRRRRHQPRHRLLRRPRAGQRAAGRERAAAPAARRRRRSEIAAAKGSLAELTELQDLARPSRHRRLRRRDRRGRRQGRRQLRAHVPDSTRAATPASRWTCPSSSARADGRARRPGRVGVEDAAQSCSASTTRNFGVGAQLVQGAGIGPTGHRGGPARQQPAALLGDRRQRNVGRLKKGDVAVTLGSLGEPFPASLVDRHRRPRASSAGDRDRAATPSCVRSSTSTRSPS